MTWAWILRRQLQESRLEEARKDSWSGKRSLPMDILSWRQQRNTKWMEIRVEMEEDIEEVGKMHMLKIWEASPKRRAPKWGRSWTKMTEKVSEIGQSEGQRYLSMGKGEMGTKGGRSQRAAKELSSLDKSRLQRRKIILLRISEVIWKNNFLGLL